MILQSLAVGKALNGGALEASTNTRVWAAKSDISSTRTIGLDWRIAWFESYLSWCQCRA